MRETDWNDGGDLQLVSGSANGGMSGDVFLVSGLSEGASTGAVGELIIILTSILHSCKMPRSS